MAAPGTSRRILIVDDDRDGADSLGLLLALDGHRTFVSYDGDTAVQMLASERPEIVFLDIGMPDVSGYELCRRIRRESWGQSMLVFALTGWARDEDRRQAGAAGFDGHLIKPVTLDKLRSLLADPSGGSARLRHEARKDPLGVAPSEPERTDASRRLKST